MAAPGRMLESKARWEHFAHEADVGVRGFGRSPAEAFEQGALALTAVITNAPIEPKTKIEVSCEAQIWNCSSSNGSMPLSTRWQ